MSVPKKIVAVSCLPMIAVIVGLFLIYCAEDTPDRCGDGHALNTYTQFCHNGQTVDKCDGNVFNPDTGFCDASTNTVLRLCGNKNYTSSTQFCSSDSVYTKCGGNEFDPRTHGCENNLPRKKCGNNLYDTTTQFCRDNVILPLCDKTEDGTYDGENPCDSYSLTINNEVADTTFTLTFKKGATVQYNANTGRKVDRRFTRWETDSVTIADPNIPTLNFAMPENNVTVTAKYEPLYQVTVESEHSNATGGGLYGEGDVVSISAGTSPDWKFDRWTTTSNGVIPADTNSAGTFFIMPANAVTVTAKFLVLFDSRNNKHYRTVRIGNQTWMAENLNYAGTPNDPVGVCYDNNTSNCVKYGRLYRWVEAMNIDQSFETTSWTGSDANHQGICPVGWHVPSSAEWDTLAKSVGGDYEGGYTQNWSYAGTKLKSDTGWNASNNVNATGTDEYGFSALPGGVGCPLNRHNHCRDDFNHVGNYGGWWSATEYDAARARDRYMEHASNHVGSHLNSKDYKMSLRCVMDPSP